MKQAFASDKIIKTVLHWIETIVVNLNLCPFAKHELIQNRIRFVVTEAITQERLLFTLQDELALLNSDNTIETTLFIHPNVLQDFYDYNQFLTVADRLLVQMDLEGVYQIASFHPDYQFGGTEHDSVENYTNRSPYPMLHILREESLERAIANHPDTEQIPGRNIKLMNKLGSNKMELLLQTCFQK